MLSSNPKEASLSLHSSGADLMVLYDDEFNYLTKMCLTNMRSAALDLAATASAVEIPALIYSSDATDHSPIYLEQGYDAIIVGEGELTLGEAVNSIEKGDFEEHRSEINGLRYLDQGGVHSTPGRPMVKDLDWLPDPDFKLVDIPGYRDLWRKHHGYFSMNLSTTRGCPFHCNWCAKPIYGQIYHTRSPPSVAAQVQFMRDEFKVDHLWITDDIFGLKPDWIGKFADELAKLQVKVPYKCLNRADLLLRGTTIKDLDRSGCESIWIGAESGSQKILDAMEKGITVAQIHEATIKVRETQMKIAFFLQFGYTGEMWEDILKTRELVRELLPDDIGISVSYPLPGTSFYHQVKDQMNEKQNWADSGDLDLMFTGTYPRDFYRYLQRLVHAEYRLQKIFRRRRSKIPLAPYHLLQVLTLRRKLHSIVRATSDPS